MNDIVEDILTSAKEADDNDRFAIRLIIIVVIFERKRLSSLKEGEDTNKNKKKEQFRFQIRNRIRIRQRFTKLKKNLTPISLSDSSITMPFHRLLLT